MTRRAQSHKLSNNDWESQLRNRQTDQILQIISQIFRQQSLETVSI